MSSSEIGSKDSEKLRAFIALRMTPEVEDAMARFVAPLRALKASVSWVQAANWHLTLRFHGDRVRASRLYPLKLELERIAGAIAPFEVGARGLGAFPNLGRPRVLWAGLTGEPLI